MGGGHHYKISDILTQDVKSINKYLLIAIILIILTCAGGTSYALFSYEAYASTTIHIRYNPPEMCDEIEIDTSNANNPKENLPSNMIAVCYDSKNDVWRKADTNNSKKGYKWYSYSDKVWANAVTVSDTNTTTSITLGTREQQSCDGKCNREDYLNAPVGSVIPMSDINTMFVWIPRFSATGNYDTYNGTNNINNPGAFNITFVNKNTNAHEAFTFGEDNLNGMWVGKFENSSNVSCSITSGAAVGVGCNLTTIRPKILPDVLTWTGASTSTIFYDILAMTENKNQYGFNVSEVDTHMMKNSEWGAVAYLTQSIYGRCSHSTNCLEVYVNNSSKSYTGRSGGAGAGNTSATKIYGSSITTDTAIYNNYGYYTYDGYMLNYKTNEKSTTRDFRKVSSTTGNIYGVYDMSGGAYDLVMGVHISGTTVSVGNSGFTSLPDSKYYNTYTNTGSNNPTSSQTNYKSSMQHALLETAGWYGDNKFFVTNLSREMMPWFRRGGLATSTSPGIFYYYYFDGNADSSAMGSRTVLVK